MAQEEQVLVVPRSVVEGIGRFQGVMPEAGRYIPVLFAPGAGKYIPRARAEQDPSHKQIIPYVIMRSAGYSSENRTGMGAAE